MNTPLIRVLIAIPAAGLAGGCARSSHDHDHAAGHGHAGHAHVEGASLYREGHGLRFAERAATFVGLVAGEVGVRDLAGVAAVPAVPAGAVLRTARGAFVFVDNGGWWLRTPVITGVADAEWIEVKEGLYEGDVVAVAGVNALWLAEIAAVNGGVGCADGH